jgi:hypothetical protein
MEFVYGSFILIIVAVCLLYLQYRLQSRQCPQCGRIISGRESGT